MKDKIINVIDSFETLMVGCKKESGRRVSKEKKLYKICKGEKSSKKSSEKMLLVPSLKHRVLKMNLS